MLERFVIDKDDVLFLYFIGLFLISVGVGILQNSWGWGILIFGLGCALISAIYDDQRPY